MATLSQLDRIRSTFVRLGDNLTLLSTSMNRIYLTEHLSESVMYKLYALMHHPSFCADDVVSYKELVKLCKRIPKYPIYERSWIVGKERSELFHFSLNDTIMRMLRDPVLQPHFVWKPSFVDHPQEAWNGKVWRESKIFGIEFIVDEISGVRYYLGSDVEVSIDDDTVIAQLVSIFFENDQLCAEVRMYKTGLTMP